MRSLQAILFYILPVIVGVYCIQTFKVKYPADTPKGKLKPYLLTILVIIPVIALDFLLWNWLGPILFGA